MVGIIGTKINPYGALHSLIHRNSDATLMANDFVTYVFHNDQDQQHYEKKYPKDVRENRAEFLDELTRLEFDFLNQDAMTFLNMVDTETIYKLGDMNA